MLSCGFRFPMWWAKTAVGCVAHGDRLAWSDLGWRLLRCPARGRALRHSSARYREAVVGINIRSLDLAAKFVAADKSRPEAAVHVIPLVSEHISS